MVVSQACLLSASAGKSAGTGGARKGEGRKGRKVEKRGEGYAVLGAAVEQVARPVGEPRVSESSYKAFYLYVSSVEQFNSVGGLQ